MARLFILSDSRPAAVLRRRRQQRRRGWLALRERRATAISAVIAGGVLVGWMTTQIVLLGYRHPVQLLYLLCGVATLLTRVVLAAFDRGG